MTEEKTPKFLFKTKDFKNIYSELGNRIQYDKSSDSLKAIYADLKHHVRDQNTAIRHTAWQKFYELKFNEKYTIYIEKGLTKKQATKRAHQFAISETATQFNVTESAVRKEISSPY